MFVPLLATSLCSSFQVALLGWLL